ncbi:hypothetical protein Ddye_027696 [Dipteronia dyeriana]|uniref:ADP-ribosyl cyclase/cyclic ADP-ribose hydrolase n=1 Tax=Dipteronia dyeriana TaxID=168575 RepID=A0AAD9WQR7_9ROSI|nr:hypothetical protein Ddye_027696 [Dipteronia dyeriana]
MANSSTPSSSITTLTKKHEVFLSFRGEDTRYGFTSHLYDALCRKKIETFIDYRLERGDEISPALLGAIEGSKIAVVIFSENYASSKWCLRELAEIIKYKKMNKHTVMPVFYHIDPSEVRNLTGSFKCSFANEEKELQEEVQKWREALIEASNLSGWDSSVIRHEAKLVGEIVKGVCRKLRSEYISSSSNFEGLMGIHKRIEQVMSLLCLDMEDVRIIGIWGMGGIGKTTIAQAVFKSISYKFDGACFIEKVEKRLENDGSNRVQLEVLSEILHEENLKLGIPTIHPFIMEMLNQQKVFIVLDDVNNFFQLETLVECLNRCGLGSRIIITSRDKQVLHNFNIDDHEIYEAEGFNDDEALELFSKYANPTEDFMALSKRIVHYAEGNPLVLKVLGSSLKGKSKQEWENALDNLQEIVNSEIFDILKTSYDGLKEKEKNLFLDIACLYDLYNWDGPLKEELLDCEYSLSVLIAKSLITIDMKMHDLLQEMGIEIVRRESPTKPGKRSRLWKQDDVIRTLKNNTGTDAVEVISLDMDNLGDVQLSSQVFDKMHNLRFLLFNYKFKSNRVHLPDGLNYIPDELRILHWRGYPLRALPSNFNPEKLVKLDLSGSNIEQLWEGTKHAPKLKWLNLSYCPHLTGIPNLSDFPSLEEVHLRDCKSLVDLTSAVQQLNNLRYLNLYGCINVTKFPLISGNIERLSLIGTAIEEVPSSIQSLTNLTELDLSECTRLKHVSPSICKLKSLSTLDLTDCSQLETFPEILETMESLKSLDLSETPIKVLPSSIEHLNGLQLLTLSNCKNLEMLPSSICNLSCLERLDLSNCSELDKLPDNLGNLKSLKRLQVEGSAVDQLPTSITCLENLESLCCSGCRGLTRLPPLSGLHSLRTLRSNNCNLIEIHEDIGCLSSLKRLELSGNMFESLPKSIKQLSKLKILSLRDCKMLRSLPEFPEGLKCLEAMDCDQLCQVPDASEFVRCINSKSHHFVNFIFTNSLNLKAVSNVFEESLRIMQLKEKDSGKPSNRFSFYLSGSEIPEYFSYRSLESSVNTQVLWKDLVNRKFLGFAICAVLAFDEYNSRGEHYILGVYCNYKAYHDRMKICNGGWHYPTETKLYRSIFMDSKHMFLGYCSFSSFYSSFQNPKKLPTGDNDYVDILIEFKSNYDGCNRLKCCAVHPIYAEEPIEKIGATIKEIGETNGRRSDRSNDNDEEVEPHPTRICLDLFR